MISIESLQDGRTYSRSSAYDSRGRASGLRRLKVTSHVAQNDALTKTGHRRTSAIDRHITRRVRYRIFQSCRAIVECIFALRS